MHNFYQKDACKTNTSSPNKSGSRNVLPTAWAIKKYVTSNVWTIKKYVTSNGCKTFWNI